MGILSNQNLHLDGWTNGVVKESKAIESKVWICNNDTAILENVLAAWANTGSQTPQKVNREDLYAIQHTPSIVNTQPELRLSFAETREGSAYV